MHHGKIKWITVITYHLILERGAERIRPIKGEKSSNCILYCMDFEKQ